MLLEDLEKERVFVSFGGACPYRCRHCYTFCDNYQYDPVLKIDELVDSLQGKKFNLIYISGHKENFVNPDDGLELCEKLFSHYSVDILLTTRNIFNQKQLERLCKLNERMKIVNKDLYVCVSIPALKSYKKIESSPLIPSPDERIDFVKRIYERKIHTVLTLRPLFPNSFIPTSEPLEILQRCKDHVSAVISSGIVVDDTILSNLENFPKDITYNEGKLMKCLEQDINVRYVDVKQEYSEIEEFCKIHKIYLNEHSIPVIQYLKKIKSI